MRDDEILRLEAYLKHKLSPLLEVRKRPGAEDTVEVYKDDEFLGVIFKDDEDPKDISYNFDMAILEMDLPRKAPS
jgi:hypothetical protein